MPDLEADRQAEQYWQHLLTRANRTQQNVQALGVVQREAPAQTQTEAAERPRRQQALDL